MIRIHLIIFLICCTITSAAQSADSIPASVSDTAHHLVEIMPKFPGGDEALFKFLQQNLEYPKDAKDHNIQGIVYATFIVEKDGKLSNITILRGLHPSCDKEVLRVLALSPDWSPGVQDGRKVRVRYNLPVRFVLMGRGTKKNKKRK